MNQQDGVWVIRCACAVPPRTNHDSTPITIARAAACGQRRDAAGSEPTLKHSNYRGMSSLLQKFGIEPLLGGDIGAMLVKTNQALLCASTGRPTATRWTGVG
jgi:hypothetical protein